MVEKIISSIGMNKKDLKKLSKSELIKLLLKQDTKKNRKKCITTKIYLLMISFQKLILLKRK